VSSNYAFWRYLFWPELAGTVFLLAGFVLIRRRLSFNLADISVLGRVFVPVPLAVFGAEHLASAAFMKDMVPNWMPGHLFSIYFVGCALFAAAISILTMKYVRLSASLLGLMLLLFVVLLHVPNVIAHPGDRFKWAVATRDFSFALGAWTLAATQMAEAGSEAGRRAIVVCRSLFALVLVFYGVEHLRYPTFTPGVPLPQEMPVWIPVRAAWGYVTGIMLLVSGVSLLAGKYARAITTFLGITVTLVVLCINTPMLAVATLPTEITTAVNYVADTMLFAGMIFFVAAAVPLRSRVPELVEAAA
jgi:uncharacterized membrane protein